MIFAKIIHPEFGTEEDRKKIEKLDTFGIYQLLRADVGGSHTSIKLRGFEETFNSIQFEFYDENGNDVNIYCGDGYRCE